MANWKSSDLFEMPIVPYEILDNLDQHPAVNRSIDVPMAAAE